jgi:hypothetical protein
VILRHYGKEQCDEWNSTQQAENLDSFICFLYQGLRRDVPKIVDVFGPSMPFPILMELSQHTKLLKYLVR